MNIGIAGYTVTSLLWDTLDSYANSDWSNVYSGAMAGDDDFYMLWRVPTSVGNDIQGDEVTFTVDFTLTQIP